MRFVALLHAINLGQKRKVSMTELRRLLGELGFEHVQTYIQSGNAVFDADANSGLRARLEGILEAHFGFPVPVTLRTADQWQAAVEGLPAQFQKEQVTVAFLAGAPAAEAVSALRARDVSPERWAIVGTEVYQTVPEGVRNLRLSHAVLERMLGTPCTVRNWRTVQAIAALL